ncbi:putative gustatory receptor 59d [Drosophila mojavensis]|uniref:Gustatory receptor n=1 Tax=Drosophila mojavensis TaxID=7230 RepID=B4KS74_DROMO|nr:putative gustatory receptor 59d [Drosophila mojavensis]EDW10510.1 uncharacterized protein Dmoj_GI21135 [Drosophila mojavensis]
MFDPVKLILRLVYFYSRLLGVLNFEIDLRTGRGRITRRASIYAAAANVMIFSQLIILSNSELMHTMWLKAGVLHEYLYLVIHTTRLSCVSVTLLSRWWQRRRLIELINALSRLAFRRPEVTRMWRHRVVIKCLSILFLEVFQVILTLIVFERFMTVYMAVSIILLYTLTALVNVIISHIYFINLNVYCHYCLLNRELKAVLVAARSLEAEPGLRTTRMSRYFTLTEQLEDIARTQSQLQNLLQCSSRIFGIQSLCVSAITYISVMATIYFIIIGFNVTKAIPSWKYVNLLLFCETFFYFADVLITMDNLYIVLDVHGEMLSLLQQFSTLAPGLDSRFEMAYESFQLQLVRNPLKFKLYNLYKMDRSTAVAMFSSVIRHSLYLVQYEVQNRS